VPLKDSPCAYCGTSLTRRTKGHVIPRSLYPDSLPGAKRITVPECTDCKRLWEDAEPQFRNIMIAIWDPDEIVRDSRFDSMRRGFLLQCDGDRRLEDFAERVASVDTPLGQRKMIFPAKDPQFNLVLRRIVRGLCHFHELDSPVTDNRVLCDVMEFEVPEAFQPEFAWHEISLDFCRYGYTIVRSGTLHSFWLIQFSKHIEFFGAISASQSGFPSETKRRD